MPQGDPRSGERYLHFKQKLYQVITRAIHSETGEELVVYQALYGDFAVYARPLSMFISEVDRQKYPKATQRYRFRLLEDSERLASASTEVEVKGADGREGAGPTKEAEGTVKWTKEAGEEARTAKETEEPKNGMSAGRAEKGTSEKEEPGQKEITSLLMDFYDADSCQEKYDILVAMQADITNVMIDNMAVVLDIVIPEGELYDRYEELKRCLRTRQKYEMKRN